MGISRNRLRIRRSLPVIQSGTARLHPKGTSSRFALRAPRQGSASCISALPLQHPVEKIKNRHQSGFFRSNFSFSVAFAEKIRYDGR